MRTIRSIWTFISQELYTGLSLIVGFVATPLLLLWLGDQRFGAFEAMTDWSGHLGLLEFGLADGVQPVLAHALGRGDKKTVRKVFIATLRGYLLVTLVIIVTGLAGVFLVARFIPVNPEYVRDLRRAWLVNLCIFPLLPLSAFRHFAQSQQKGYWVNALLMAQWFIGTMLSLLLAWVGWGITGQAVALLIGGIVFHVGIFLQGRRELPGVIGAALSKPADDDSKRAISALRWPSLMLNVCGRVNFWTDNIIVAFLLSPAMVVPFFVTQRLATLAARELQAVGGASWAALAEIRAQERYDLFNDRLIELTNLVSILGMTVLVPITVYNHYFVERWVGAPRFGGTALTVLASIVAILMAISSLWGWSLQGTGHPRRMVPGIAGQSTVKFVAGTLLTVKFGMIGPLLGTVLGFLAGSMWFFPMLMSQLFKTDLTRLFMAVLQPVALAIPYATAVWLFAESFGAPAWWTIIWQMSAAAILYLSLASVLLISSSQRVQWMERIRLFVTARSVTIEP